MTPSNGDACGRLSCAAEAAFHATASVMTKRIPADVTSTRGEKRMRIGVLRFNTGVSNPIQIQKIVKSYLVYRSKMDCAEFTDELAGVSVVSQRCVAFVLLDTQNKT